MEIILIRHGLPVREENEKTNPNPADPPLAPMGNEQAERLADWLAFEPIDHIAVSPKLRAQETAAPLAKQMKLEPEIIPGFSEIDRNTRLYIPIEEMRREKHPQYHRLMKGDWDAAGFMDPKEFQKEVWGAYEKLVERWSKGHTLVIVAHGGTINAIVSYILGLKDVFFCDLYYTSVSRLKLNTWGQKDNMRLWNLNDIAHLHSKRDTLEPHPKI